MDDMNALLRGLHVERRARQGLPVPPVEAPAPVEPPSPVVEAPAQDVAPDEPPPAPADADDGSVRDPDAVVVEQLVDDAELVAVPPLMRPDQAERRYDEAVAVTVEKCAADTAGQTCYICLETVHPDTNEGLVRGCSCRGGAGFVHVSCLARGAQVEVQRDVQNGWKRWSTCRLCEQLHHGVVRCALGWACWKTYAGRPETDSYRCCAMGGLGQGLESAGHHEDALTVREALLSTERRVGASEESILVTQGNLANTYSALKRDEEALSMRQGVYSTCLELYGEDHEETLRAANNYASTLLDPGRFEEAKSLLREVLPVARRVLGEGHRLALKMRWNYAKALYKDDGATLDDLREAVGTLEDTVRTGRRVFGGAHPTTKGIEFHLRKARAALCAREDAEPDVSAQELDAAEAAAAAAAGDGSG